jgi:hypothetical protein
VDPEFGAALSGLGFLPVQQRASRGPQTFVRNASRYLSYYVHLDEDATALFTWEFAITDLLSERGIQLGSSEALNLFMFPQEDERGPRDAAWVAGAMARAETLLAGLRFQ